MSRPWLWSNMVRYYETDRMGVVHHSNYLRILEDARMDYLEAIGLSYPGIEQAGVIIPCVGAEEKFLSFLRFGDRYQVVVQLEQYTGARISFTYQITREGAEQPCFTARTEHCFTRDGDYFPVNLKHKLPQHHAKLLELLAEQ